MMKSLTLKGYIEKIVTESGPIKGTEIATDVALGATKTEDLAKAHEIIQALTELVDEGRIIEIEYILPQMNYRVKSMYFPKGTSLTVLKGNKK